jgi:2-isopropylmalate synthase
VAEQRVLLYDTTLRDGTQSEGISLSVDDKLKITRLLDRLGLHYVEGGWPGANPKDTEYFRRVRELRLEQARIAAFGCTCRIRTLPEEDASMRALLEANTAVVALVGKSSTLHVSQVLRATLEENLHIIRESVAYLKSRGREVVFDAEHFFDGHRADTSYALATLRAAVQGGADWLALCDTNGGSMPWDIQSAVEEVHAAFPDTPLGIHAHNDGGLAVANSLAGVRGGATQVQGTMNGWGERCGNADLCALIANLELKLGLSALPAGRLAHLARIARTVGSIANEPVNHQAPYVGRSAFAHKAGIHVAAMRRSPESYQHINPALVGNQSRVLISELSGRGNLQTKAEQLGITLGENDNLADVLQAIKELEHRGYSFEGAEASVELLLKRSRPGYRPAFEVLDFMAVVEHREGRGTFAEAMIKVRANGRVVHTAAEGSGPVDALYAAIRKALLPAYPYMDDFRMVDYKVRVLDGARGTGATTRVLRDTQNSDRRWITVGASPDVIEASWLALADSVEYGLDVARAEREEEGAHPTE